MNYTEYKKKRQKEFDELPLFFAFSDKQLKEALEERNATVKDVVRLGGTVGTLCLKKDLPVIQAFHDKPDPIDELLKDPTFAEEAFYYEMGNHEYHINYQGNWDVLSCFGNIEYNDEDDPEDYFKQLNFTEPTIKAYYNARRKFLKDAEENDRF